MFGNTKKTDDELNKKDLNTTVELSDDDLEEVSGGGSFSSIPRVPNNPIGKELEELV